MSLFVTPDDYKRKAKPEILGFRGEAPAKNEKSEPPDTRSEVDLAAARIAKFVPSLVILGYAGLCNLVNSKDIKTEPDLRLRLFKIAFWSCVALTPIYIFHFDRMNRLRWRNVLVGTVAFPIWAYAFPCGWMVDTKLYDPVIAGFVLMLFSLITAFIPAPKFDGK